MDLNKDFTTQTIALTPDYEGEVKATLISSNSNQGSRKSVLYVHGYIDYFFHAHMGQKFNTQGYDFYALDLRKYGRSLMEHQHPNYCIDIEEYFEEISIVLRQIHEASKERSEEHTSELQSRPHLVCRLLLEKKKKPRPSIGGRGGR